MKLRLNSPRQWRQARMQRQNEWHEWFAWRPVSVGPKDIRWLEWVLRRKDYVMGMNLGTEYQGLNYPST